MRVHELAKELKLTSKELLAKLKALGISAASHVSVLEPETITRLKKEDSSESKLYRSAAPVASATPPTKGRKPSALEPGKSQVEQGRQGVESPEAKRLPASSKTSKTHGTPARSYLKVPEVSTAVSPARSAPKTAGPLKPLKPKEPVPARAPSVSAKPQAAPASVSPAVVSRPVGRVGISKPTPPVSQPPLHETPTHAGVAAVAKVTAKPKVATATTTAQAAVTGAKPTKTVPPSSVAVSTPKAVVSLTATTPTVQAVSPVPAPVVPSVPRRQIHLRCPISVKDLAMKLEVKVTDLIKYLIQQGTFASVTQQIDESTAIKAAAGFNCEIIPEPTLEEQIQQTLKPDPAKLVPRAPVVTFMGHVDHGKTSLLDAIRQAKVAQQETGGITQHIGAYAVELEKGRVTFLDTPGHEAFTALRVRGAHVTDIVVLVVAADDGVMPQTLEAINHAKAANVPIVVAINKVDKPDANLQKVKQQLAQYELVAEDWGGKTVMVPVSAKTRQGLDTLLEMLLLEAEMLELKADPTLPAQGVVIEAKQTKTKGPVVTLLIQHGTLHIGDTLLIGPLVGRVRAMSNDRGVRLKEVGPAQPVEVLGLPEVPHAGDRFVVVVDEKFSKQLAQQRRSQREQQAMVHPKRITLEELHQRILEGRLKELRLVLKADVQGSLEAIVQSLQKLDTEKTEVQFKILHGAVGDISESDIILAAASDAIVVGFHVGIEPQVQVLAATEGVDVHIYQIIYELVNAIRAAIEGLLEPTLEETFIGRAEIRKLFQVSRYGMVAGCMVVKGTIRRDAQMRVIRGSSRIYEGKINNLKRVKDDVREVQEGVECGILLEGNADLQVGDLIEAWQVKKVARKLA